MLIERINIKNFRNINFETVDPGKNINVIFGENANGKTSFIESIYLISNLQSFRTSAIRDVINFDSDNTDISCFYIKNKCKEKLNVKLNKSEKKYTKNDRSIKIDDYLWSLSTVVFHPDDILIVNGSPGLRRQIIDRSIFYTDIEHFENLKKLNVSLKNKNACLREGHLDNIEEWDNLVSKYSFRIIEKRKIYIKRINEILKNKSESKYEICLDNYNEDSISEKYINNKINQNKNNELKYKKSLIGAHRQLISIKLNGKCLKSFGSQGQKRKFILIFKSSQIDDFFNINSFYPILLLDDMASELDLKNKNIILNLVEDFSGQTFITTTDKDIFNFKKNVCFFEVLNGNIRPIS